MMKRLARWIKRLFTHPYGSCTVADCDNSRHRWMDLCDKHRFEQIQIAALVESRRRFKYDVDVMTEALRRVQQSNKETD